MNERVYLSTTYTLVQRRDSKVAHVVLARPGWRDTNTLCAQWAPGHSSWPVQPGALTLCARCAKKVPGGTTDTRDRTTGAPAGAQGRETHARSEVATTDGDAGQ